jgi:hypothetical protein
MPKLNRYEVLISYTQSVRLIIHAKSAKAAERRVEEGEWDHHNEIDSECLDLVVCDVTLAPKSGRQS